MAFEDFRRYIRTFLTVADTAEEKDIGRDQGAGACVRV